MRDALEREPAFPNRLAVIAMVPAAGFEVHSMTTQERESVCLVALCAAFSDGTKSDAERAQLRGLLEQLEIPNATQLVSRVLLNPATLNEAVAALTSAESRTLAYEMAVCLVEADGRRNTAETQFLTGLATQLNLPAVQSASTLQLADDVVASAGLPAVPSVPVATAPAPDDAALDATIHRTAILAGALELLPQSAATLAVLPLQTHLVYRIGKHYGHPLDAGHVKEFLGVLGFGLASQAVEGMARKFLGRLVRQVGGGLTGTLASIGTGPVVTFATTHALGQLARRYYSGGRTLGALQLKTTFRELLGEARAKSASVLPEMQERARGLNLSQLPALIRGV